ncbi:hypothetical protein [Blastopirellula retiformator]|uniref:Carboxypeptidase regulatory-like domain-containing protein n=1 Tax=Blastopirellula retiformator TaxID=2527970 RepID=A0A5C5V796_9BACT|nr:hypothetical protein [Blastopirellula retiformator]TWT34438.1 hypothetical protein Enr8_18460 [Blastopirellula retiformator]
MKRKTFQTPSLIAWLGTAVCLLAVGCSGGGSTDDLRQSVHGVIYCGAHPLKSGGVRFEPVDQGSAAETVSAPINSSGEFQLETDGGMGILPGHYRVIVLDEQGSAEGEVKNRLGQIGRYGDTGHLAHVVANANNEFRFQMAGPDGARDMPEGE